MSERTLIVGIAVAVLIVAGGNSAGAQGQGQGSAPVTIVNPLPLPVTVGPLPLPVTVGPVMIENLGRVSFDETVSLETGEASKETSTRAYEVAEGTVFVIENIQYDTNAGCFYKYQPTVIVDRPNATGVSFERYNLAIVSPDAFTSGGGAFLSAANHLVSINVQPNGGVRFGFSRNATNCFGQIRIHVDGRLEAAK